MTVPGTGEEPDAPSGRGRGHSRRLRPLVRFALALLAGCVLLELVLRLLLFGGGVFARLGAPLRRAELYADPSTDELYYTLRLVLGRRPALARVPVTHDSVLGWGCGMVDPATQRHLHEDRLAGRRPVLLYGDSYAACSPQREPCWETLLERSELGARYALLNFGVSGYGLDQICLLLERTVPAYAALDPLVLVGVFVDDDLERVGKRFTTLPKPWFEIEQGELVLHAPLGASQLEFLEAAPPRTPSYAWRRLLRSGLLPERWSRTLLGTRAEEERLAALSRLLVARIHGELERRGLEHAFLLFHGSAALRVDCFGWQEPLLLEELARLGVRHVATRPEFRADMQRTGRALEHYFTVEGRVDHHYSSGAQEVAFGAIRRALTGDFDAPRAGGGAR